MGVFLANALTATTRRNSFLGVVGGGRRLENTWKHGKLQCTADSCFSRYQPACSMPACLPAIKGTKVRELSLSEMFFYAEGVVVQGCVCLCVFVSSITKVQFGATKSVNRKSTWRSKTCTGKKLGTRRHKMQDESSSNG